MRIRLNGRTADVAASASVVAIAVIAQLSPWIAAASILIVVCFVLAAFSDSKATIWLLICILSLPAALFPSIGGLESDATYKGVLTVALLLIAFREGLHRSAPINALFALYIAALVVSLLGFSAGGLDFSFVAKASLGFTYYWLGALIAWKVTSPAVVLQAIRTAPLICVGASLIFGPLLHKAIFQKEYSGAVRLAAMLIPAHLAMLALAAVAASLFIMFMGFNTRASAIWLVVNFVILLMTLTRGAALAAVILLMFGGMAVGQTNAGRSARNGVRAAILIAGFSALALIPSFLSRNQGNSYEGSFNTSGRSNSWDFYLGVAEKSPWFGYGPGYSSVAVSELAPTGVQSVFAAPHNEFIHFYVDYGLPIAAGIFATIGILWISTAKRLPGPVSTLWVGFGIAFAVYAFVDNPLSTPQFGVPLALIISVLYSWQNVRKRDLSASLDAGVQ
ncbi:O-antigen ligase family protein [Mycolicibacterium monacense]|uniref:O-antigen ligase family protein n=1 Tax=Mycolicibacterium monacense TaxID=85693 RepID=UPI0009EF146E|nr:O-antigen ligase family protein [Mycolicibacterium monacense]